MSVKSSNSKDKHYDHHHPPRTHWIGGSYLAACGLSPAGIIKKNLDHHLLAAIAASPGCSTHDLITTGASEGRVRRHLKKLVEAGRIYSDRKVNLYKTPVDHWYTKKLT